MTEFNPWVLGHILLGVIALFSGAAALVFRKGSPKHKRAGRWFVISMLGMSSSGGILAAMTSELLSVLAGSLTFYLVASGWLTLRPNTTVRRRFEWAGFGMALTIGTAGWAMGTGLLSPELVEAAEFPPINYRIFASIALFAATMDGNRLICELTEARTRLIRHLWRMILAMLIATISLFLGQARLFPEVIQTSGVLNLPILAVMLCLIYHLLARSFNLIRKRRAALDH